MNQDPISQSRNEVHGKGGWCILWPRKKNSKQSADAFREKLGAFRKLTKSKAELTFVNAPFRVADENDATQSPSPGARGWWFSRENDSFDALESSDVCKGYKQSLDFVCRFVDETGFKFDGLLGFSQGAAFVALLCVLAQRKELPFDFKFAIIIAGFKSRCSSHANMYGDTNVTIPTLHVFGENDKVIPKELSQDLARSFEKPTLLVHVGGHFLPVTGQQKSVYLTFLSNIKE
uniref:Serine hydrolase domain-containing protein n=1 Tax=Strigamia maritima TaxID=126957 RepID=T1JI19_STRMM